MTELMYELLIVSEYGRNKMIIYDIEIANAILGRGEAKKENIHYCQGWKDFANMGISTICCYDYDSDRYRVFCQDNLADFEELVRKTDMLVGFNSIAFDNNILACVLPGLTKEYLDSKSYDILVEIWDGAGLKREFSYPSHIGYSLGAMSKVNGIISGKTGNGTEAPVWYQSGQFGKLIDYCLSDIWLTKNLLDKIVDTGRLTNPKMSKDISGELAHKILTIKRPGE